MSAIQHAGQSSLWPQPYIPIGPKLRAPDWVCSPSLVCQINIGPQPCTPDHVHSPNPSPVYQIGLQTHTRLIQALAPHIRSCPWPQPHVLDLAPHQFAPMVLAPHAGPCHVHCMTWTFWQWGNGASDNCHCFPTTKFPDAWGALQAKRHDSQAGFDLQARG